MADQLKQEWLRNPTTIGAVLALQDMQRVILNQLIAAASDSTDARVAKIVASYHTVVACIGEIGRYGEANESRSEAESDES